MTCLDKIDVRVVFSIQKILQVVLLFLQSASYLNEVASAAKSVLLKDFSVPLYGQLFIGFPAGKMQNNNMLLSIYEYSCMSSTLVWLRCLLSINSFLNSNLHEV